jgi:hypothetical protein
MNLDPTFWETNRHPEKSTPTSSFHPESHFDLVGFVNNRVKPFRRANELDLSRVHALNTNEASEIPKFPVLQPMQIHQSIVSIQKWEGHVLQVLKNSFAARLADLTSPVAEEDAEFPLSKVSADDLPLVREGAVFYWSIVDHTDLTGRLHTISTLRFRRLPPWTPEEIQKASLEAKKIAKLLGVEEPCLGSSESRRG